MFYSLHAFFCNTYSSVCKIAPLERKCWEKSYGQGAAVWFVWPLSVCLMPEHGRSIFGPQQLQGKAVMYEGRLTLGRTKLSLQQYLLFCLTSECSCFVKCITSCCFSCLSEVVLTMIKSIPRHTLIYVSPVALCVISEAPCWFSSVFGLLCRSFPCSKLHCTLLGGSSHSSLLLNLSCHNYSVLTLSHCTKPNTLAVFLVSLGYTIIL